MTRSRMSRTGAQNPIDACVGSRPISAVAPEMSRIVIARTDLRPMRSPIGPQTIPPRGRKTKEIAKPSMVPTVPNSPGKNACVR